VEPQRFEILVVDNASTDDTSSLVSRFIDLHPRHAIRRIDEAVPGLLSGRHRGAREARADILCFVDDDIVADPDWLACLLAGFDDPDVHLVGGPSNGRFEQAPPDWMERFTTSVPEGQFLDSLSLIDLGSVSRDIEAYFVWGLNFNIRKHTLVEMGGFHPDGVPLPLVRYRGDGEGGLSHKIIERGYRTLYHPGAKVEHVIATDRLSVEYFKRRKFLQGISDSYSEIRRTGRAEAVASHPHADGTSPEAEGSAEPFVETLRRELERAHADGANFHAAEVTADPALLAWVLRSDYLHDYSYGEVKTTELDALPSYFQQRGTA